MTHVSTLARGASCGEYPRLNVVQVVARALGCEASTAAQALKPTDPRSPFTRAAMIAEALYAAGHGARADALLLPLDLVRIHAPALTEPLLEVMRDEEQADGREGEAQVDFAAEPSPTTWATYRRQLVGYLAQVHRLIRRADAEYGRPA